MKRKPCSEATKAKISAAMRGNKNGRPHRKTMSARVLNSLRAMEENRVERIHRFLADNPEADAARKAKIAAAIRAHWQRRRAADAQRKAERREALQALQSVRRSRLFGAKTKALNALRGELTTAQEAVNHGGRE